MASPARSGDPSRRASRALISGYRATRSARSAHAVVSLMHQLMIEIVVVRRSVQARLWTGRDQQSRPLGVRGFHDAAMSEAVSMSDSFPDFSRIQSKIALGR